MFERLRESIKAYRERKGLKTGTIWESGWITALSAGSAGAVAAVITTPVDVVKTRIMLSAVEESSTSSASSSSPGAIQQKGGQAELVDAFGKSVERSKATAKDVAKSLNPLLSAEKKGKKSAWKIGKEIVKEKGMKGLWRGGLLRAVWTMAGSGLYLSVYESGRIYLARRRGEELDEADLD